MNKLIKHLQDRIDELIAQRDEVQAEANLFHKKWMNENHRNVNCNRLIDKLNDEFESKIQQIKNINWDKNNAKENALMAVVLNILES